MLQIQKRDGSLTGFNPSKILSRIKKAGKGLKINAEQLFAKIITEMPMEGIITTKELDTLLAETAASYTSSHYDYSNFASGVAISSLYKTSKPFSENLIYLHKQEVVSALLIEKINEYGHDKLDALINERKDLESFNYFAWKGLESTYLLKNSEGQISETPQQMYLRIAIWLTDTFEEAVEYFHDLEDQYISFATPIIANSGTTNNQLASCVLIFNNGDSRQGLKKSWNDIADNSALGAGIGYCLSNQRSVESRIAKSGGFAGGLLKWTKNINEALRFFNQNGKRMGAAAIYVEIWHKDVFSLIEIRKNTGADQLRARDTFPALVVPDNFLRAVEEDGDFYLFCPNDIRKAGLKPLYEIFGEEYEIEYQKAVELGIGKKIKAMDLWLKILECQIETGTPYLLYKDSVNKKSNHKNIGTIKQSNLCIEVIQYTDEETTAICTLASLVLKNFVKNGKFDLKLLYDKTRKTVRALNKVIDINEYCTDFGTKGGKEQRAIAVGIQGLADAIYLMDLTFESEEAKQLNIDIFETIYYAAITESNMLAKQGKHEIYKYFKGSPISQGQFQFDMWDDFQHNPKSKWDWDMLRDSVKIHGVVNSMFTALMPTAGSAKITDSYEKDEPIHSNLFTRSVLGGEITIVNRYLIDDLIKLGIWDNKFKDIILRNDGSLQNIDFEPFLEDLKESKYITVKERLAYLKNKYKTVFEIKGKVLMDLCIDRAPYIDQTQSMNIYMDKPTTSKLTSSHFYAWKKGLKTGQYYLRTKAVSTGAKHLALESIETVMDEPILTSKPANSYFECEGGCSA